MFSAVAIANDFIARALREQVLDTSPSKLHELVYLAHGWHIGRQGEPLLRGTVSAAREGVLVPELREQGCWGTRRVEGLINIVAPDAEGVMISSAPQLPPGSKAGPVLDWVWQTYGRRNAFELSTVTREKDGPWDKVWHHPSRTRDEPYDIPFELLKKWFTAEVLLQQARSRAQTAAAPASDRETTQRFVLPPKTDDLRPV